MKHSHVLVLAVYAFAVNVCTLPSREFVHATQEKNNNTTNVGNQSTSPQLLDAITDQSMFKTLGKLQNRHHVETETKTIFPQIVFRTIIPQTRPIHVHR